jgi:hypothetical protein
MRIDQIRKLYPHAAEIIDSLLEDGTISAGPVERLTVPAIARIDSGKTPRRDAVMLLLTREANYGRQMRPAMLV